MSHKTLLIKTIAAIVFGVVIIDLIIGIALGGFQYKSSGNKLQTYFSYGASTVRKLNSHSGLENGTPHPLALAGWNNKLPERINKQQNCSIPITFYGMSFSNRVSEALIEKNSCFQVRQIAGPGAPLSHSYFMATKHSVNDDSKYTVLGILASSLPKITTMAHFNSAFEFPGAHIYPRYSINDSGELISTPNQVNSLEELKKTLADKESLHKLTNTLEKNDYYFNNFVFSYPSLDYSNIAKMFRRSYAQKNIRDVVGRLFKEGKFTNHQELRKTSIILLESFIRVVESNGQIPIILLINDNGYTNALDELFLNTLNKNNVRFLSSSAYIDNSDLSNFLADGHFTKANDQLLASALERIIFR